MLTTGAGAGAATLVSAGTLAVAATGATRVFVHIDVDVLDPADIVGVGSPEPFGIPAAVLVDAVRALTGRFVLAGAGITEFAPASPEDAVEDLPTILRLVAALTATR
jgi:arginase